MTKAVEDPISRALKLSKDKREMREPKRQSRAGFSGRPANSSSNLTHGKNDIQQRMAPREWKQLGVTSPAPREGKSLTALNLAITASRESSDPVILVDADTRQPSVCPYLGVEPKASLADLRAVTRFLKINWMICFTKSTTRMSLL